MPNYCNNTLNLTGPSKDIKKFYDSIKNDVVFFELIYPTPENLKGEISKFSGYDDLFEKKSTPEEYKDWYSFRVNEWGTKWDIIEDYGISISNVDDTKSTLHLSFSTAWSPPIGIYNQLTERGFKVEASYFESGTCFYGRFTDGLDEYSEYSEPNELPFWVVEEFDLEEWILDYYEELDLETEEG